MKKYYDREIEQKILKEESKLVSTNQMSRLAVITGRRRVGKTELILRSMKSENKVPFIYLFASRVTSNALIGDWLQTISNTLGVHFVPRCERLSQVIEYLLFLGKTQRINVAIDECQDINAIEPSFWSELQKIWDLNKKNSQVFLMMSGSIASAMRNIFKEYSEPLYGRVDRFIQVRPFGIAALEEILRDFNPRFNSDDLLALYTLTGGIPWFVEDLMDRGASTVKKMAEVVFQPGSKFIMDGEILLANEFRTEGTLNRTLLQAIASGLTKREELQNLAGDVSVSGSLSRLEKQYELITKEVPLFAKSERKGRYYISDRYLSFWFAFVQSKEQWIAQNNYEALKGEFLSRYETFSGRVLESVFFDIFRESKKFETLGRWWDRKGQNEIDLIAIDKTSAYFFEVKRNPKKYSSAALVNKISVFLNQVPSIQNKKIFFRELSLDDMQKELQTLLSSAQEFSQ